MGSKAHAAAVSRNSSFHDDADSLQGGVGAQSDHEEELFPLPTDGAAGTGPLLSGFFVPFFLPLPNWDVGSRRGGGGGAAGSLDPPDPAFGDGVGFAAAARDARAATEFNGAALGLNVAAKMRIASESLCFTLCWPVAMA